MTRALAAVLVACLVVVLTLTTDVYSAPITGIATVLAILAILALTRTTR